MPVVDRLECWIQIASYLKCDVRTARRWEKRGLPVHRVPGGERSAVFAYRGEIDAWLSGRAGQPSATHFRYQENAIDRLSQDNPPEIPHVQAASQPTVVGSEVVTHESKNGLQPRSVTTSPRRPFATVAGATLLVVATLTVPFGWLFRTKPTSAAAGSNEALEITSVSPILPQRNQAIVIRGRGFGLHTPYRNADSPFIAIRDNTVRWAAGRIIPQNWDEVTLDVKSWEDTQIVVSGFSGAYGAGEWKLNPGDAIEVAVWNPQSGHGPATYRLTVSPNLIH